MKQLSAVIAFAKPVTLVKTLSRKHKELKL